MRKLILILFAIIPVVGFSQVKNAGCFLRLEKPYQSDTLSMENDSVKISFRFNSLNYFCELSIENKTNEVVLIDWDKFLMVMEGESLPVLFEDTRMINKDGSKGQTPIAPMPAIFRQRAHWNLVSMVQSPRMPLQGFGGLPFRRSYRVPPVPATLIDRASISNQLFLRPKI